MDPNEENEIYDRLIIKGPTSVTISEQSEAHEFITSFLQQYKSNFEEKGIIPIRISLSSFTTALDFWKALSNDIGKELINLIEEVDRKDVDHYIQENNDATEIATIMANLKSTLEIGNENGVQILAILEDFDDIVKYQEESDIRKLREMTSCFTEFVVSRQNLKVLAESYLNDVYTFNQFGDPMLLSK